MHVTRLVGLSLALALCPVIASAAESGSPSFARGETLDAAIASKLRERGAAAVAAAVIQDGRVVWTTVHGRQDDAREATSETLFNVASLAKPVTAQIVLRLASAGKISLDEPTAPVWTDPDIEDDPRSKELTPTLLLSHRSGFPNWRYLTDGKLKFIADPGGAFGYSGEGYEYLRRFMERKLDRNFEQLASGSLFKPMNLSGMAFTKQEWMRGRIAAPFDDKRQFGKPDLHLQGDPNAADNLFATVQDYAQFMLQAMNDETLSAEIQADRFRIHTDASDKAVCKPGLEDNCPRAAGYGLGWVVFDYGDRKLIWHSGGDSSEHSMAYYVPQTRIGAVVFVNGAGAQPLILDVVDLIGHEPSISAFMRSVKQN